MYESFYGFSGDPFRLTPDRRFCYPHRTFRKAKAYLEYGVQRAEGFVMVTGRPGTGKTTLIEELLGGLDQANLRVVRLSTTRLEGNELVRMIAFNIGLRAESLDKAALLRQIIRSLDQDHKAGCRAALMVDEAQGLPEASLEELRFLTNLEKDGMPLLQVFLVGQPPLRDLVQLPVMEQLHQRMIAACHLEPLTVEELRAYVEYRLHRVGWENDPRLESEIYPVIHRVSDGIPRRVNQVFSRLLMYGFVEERRCFGMADMRAVLEDLRDEMLLPQHLHDFERVFSDLPPPPPAPEPDPEIRMPAQPERREPRVDTLADAAPSNDRAAPALDLRPAAAARGPGPAAPLARPAAAEFHARTPRRPLGQAAPVPAARSRSPRFRVAVVVAVVALLLVVGGAALVAVGPVDVSAIARSTLPGWFLAVAGSRTEATAREIADRQGVPR